MSEPFAVKIEDTPVVAREPKQGQDTADRPNSNDLVPFSRYSDVFNKTYTEKFFNIDADGHSKQGISDIEKYVLDKMEERGLKNTTEVYDRLMDEMFARLGIDKDEEDASKFFKAHTYIKMVEKMELLKTLEESETLDNKIARLLERRKK